MQIWIVLVDVERLVLLGERAAFEDGQGVGGAEAIGVVDAIFLCDQIAGSTHPGRPRFGIVSVGGKEVDPSVSEHGVGHSLRGTPHLADNRAGRNLREQPNAHPVCETFGVTLQGWIPLGMGEDGFHSGQSELIEGFVQLRGQAIVREFDQEIVSTIQSVFAGVPDRILHVVVAEVEVAAGGNGEWNGLAGESRAEGGDSDGNLLWIEVVDVVGVGCSQHMGDAVVGCNAGHGDRGLEVRRAVVQAGQQVVVNVNHSNYGQGTIMRAFYGAETLR